MHAIHGTNDPAGAGQTAVPPRLVKAAHEFEAQMMKELLKPLAAGSAPLGEDDDCPSGSNSALGEFASEVLGRALSEHGGLGIAKDILGSLSQRGNLSQLTKSD